MLASCLHYTWSITPHHESLVLLNHFYSPFDDVTVVKRTKCFVFSTQVVVNFEIMESLKCSPQHIQNAAHWQYFLCIEVHCIEFGNIQYRWIVYYLLYILQNKHIEIKKLMDYNTPWCPEFLVLGIFFSGSQLMLAVIVTLVPVAAIVPPALVLAEAIIILSISFSGRKNNLLYWGQWPQ